jgi:hypothetical protein
MASIDASIVNTGIITTGDATGNLELKSNGTTAMTIASGGKTIFANTALSTASAGMMEYDGTAPYFTPLGTQRGLIPGMQFTMRNFIVGADSTAAQNILGVGVTLSSNTVYAYFGNFNFFKTSGATGHHMKFGFGGTATIHSISYNLLVQDSNNGYTPYSATRTVTQYTPETASAVQITNDGATSFRTTNIQIQGTVRVTTGGTFIPQYQLSAAPGGAYTHSTGNFMGIYPIGTGTGNISVGTWA